MSVTVSLATMLAEKTGGETKIPMEGATVSEVLKNLTDSYPDLQSLLWRKNGEFNSMLVVFRNSEDIRGLKGLDTPVKEGDEVVLITALDGG